MASETKEHGGTTEVFAPQLLQESAGETSCCIFRFPHSLAQQDIKAYKPKIVSIGPYHHKGEQMQMIQEHKHRFLKLFIDKGNLSQKALEDTVGTSVEKIRGSYSEKIFLDDEELVKMMVLDGCFILMLFLMVSRIIEVNPDDPIFSAPWILPSLQTDLLLLENQVPFFLLGDLFSKLPETIDKNKTTDLKKMARMFFKYSLGHIIEKSKETLDDTSPNHLLDLIRNTCIPLLSSNGEPETALSSHKTPNPKQLLGLCRKTCISLSSYFKTPSHETPRDSSLGETERALFSKTPSTPMFILSAKKLYLQGINFKSRSEAKTLLDIQLKNNNLEIPRIVLDGSISSLLLNCVAFEQYFQPCSNHITSYIVFMGFLMKDKDDATFLCNQQIIENCFGTDEEVSLFFKNTSKGVTFDLAESYLAPVYEGINMYTSKWYTGYWAEFRHKHFDSPWTCISSFVAFLVIFLTGAQLYVAIRSFQNDKKEKKD